MKIRTLPQLCDLALARRSVVCPKSPTLRGPMPAAFVQNFPAVRVNQMIEMGLYRYEPRPRRTSH